jgi:CO/xanthine dehydrogenase Mo-binding subunit
MDERMVVGKSSVRIDALEKATGKALFCTDIKIPGMLYGKVLRSRYPHAKIVNIDVSQANWITGVRCVVTGEDTPLRRYGSSVLDEHVLARNVVRFVGEPIAAVAADEMEIADEALDKIKVEYEELPAIFDAEEAMRVNPSVVVHRDLFQYERGAVLGGPRFDLDRPNVFFHFKIRCGDIEGGFREADFVMGNRFSTCRIQQCALEPMVAVAEPHADGGLTMYVGRQFIWRVKNEIVALFGLKPSQVRIIQYYVGGGFGSKGTAINEELIAALLSLKSKRAVKHVFTREEVFLHGGNRAPMTIDIKDGVMSDGTLVAREMKVILNCGAYVNNNDIITRNAAFGAIGTYRVPNFKWDSYGVYTNDPPACAFRGFGSEVMSWAIESHMDMLAEKLNLDPVHFRAKNILKEGEANATGEITHSIGAERCLKKMAEWIGSKEKFATKSVWRIGKGIGLGNKYSIAPMVSMANVKVNEDETLTVYHTADEVGQGCNTVVAQIAAEEFGLPLKNVKVAFSDTLFCPYSAGGSTGSRVTYNLGNAVRLACQDAKRHLFEVASMKLHATAGELETQNGEVFVRQRPKERIRISALFMGYRGDRTSGYGSYTSIGEIIGHGIWEERAVPEDRETGQIHPDLAAQGQRLATSYSHVAHAVEIGVNVETGQVRIMRFGTAADMGSPVNPKMCEQQMEGGMGMGIGDALFEEMQMSEGEVINRNFTDYRIPSTMEIPPLEAVESSLVWVPHKDGPYGAKGGFGEGSLVGIESAIGEAVFNAVGVRIRDLPITPVKILKGLKEKGQKRL